MSGIPIGSLEQLHTKLRHDLKRELGYGIVIKTDIDPANARLGTKLEYRLHPKKVLNGCWFRRPNGGAVPLNKFAIPQAMSPPLWLSWRIVWLSEATGERHPSYVVDSAALAFYIGELTRDKELLVRAEWVPKSSSGGGPSQPHWHIHGRTNTLLPPSDSDTHGKQGAQFLVTDEMHFGMGGWDPNSPGPQWQTPLDDCNLIAEWTLGCVRVLRDELKRLAPRRHS
ncbi:MAG: hypothetical protein IH851_12440 [Armatimonadetes bacterium]|nr:hypothetical protein [Armatimonadota bacterium]